MQTRKRAIHKTLLTIIISFTLALTTVATAHAQNQNNASPTTPTPPIQKNYQGIVISATNKANEIQTLEVQITNEDKTTRTVQIENDQRNSPHPIVYAAKDKVLVLEITDPNSQKSVFYITDYNRTTPLLWLFVLFCIVVIAVSKKWGINSLIGMFYSFFIIFKFILPQLLKGHNPLFIAILGALLISPVTFYLSHGVNKKTTVALASTIISLFITGVLSLIFINAAKLTGFGSEEAFFLQIAKEGAVNIKGIFLAGIIIGTLGILDDVTISQAAIVYQLKGSVRNIDSWELFKKSMAIGHDHIASTVNTLILVYAGAALPLLLLFLNSTKTFGEAINSEMIADEIVRTLVGSIGLVLAVPISTVLAVYFADSSDTGSKHRH